jgi:hypothetical protein
MASSWSTSSDHGLAECPDCGRSALSGDEPCARCQPPESDDADEAAPSSSVFDKDRCQSCGGHVSKRFRQVFGDNDDVAHCCPDCSTNSEHFHGAAADPDADLHKVIQ